MIIIKNSSGEVIKKIAINLNKTLLEQIGQSGVEIISACHKGICGACICKIEQGFKNVDKNFKGESGFFLGNDEVMTCIGGVKNNREEIVLRTLQ